ncbi:uncharacterized protein LOC134213504 isoform X2 [Armigeres subalbatus]|uniref:uncharacterized protein LOC134213504 isoform X2 n=1 Tax=Armigeres subalbatus TaxID=124917 RepID=UPI002ED092F9
MDKMKESFSLEDVLPDDNRLGERGKTWKSFMEKYSKTEEDNGLVIDGVCDVLLDYEPSDQSDASDVETDAGCEDTENFELENREEIDEQLKQVVATRKRNWAQNGLLKLMESIEDPCQNMLSHEKVEQWLFGQKGPFDVTQANETVMTERNADGDRMKYHRKQQVTVSRSVDDADSLYSVDTAKYILQNKRDRNTTSKIKVTTMIKKYTISTNNSNTLAYRPNLHSIGSFPIIEELPSASVIPKPSKSESAFGTGDDLGLERLHERSTVSHPSGLIKSPGATQPEKRKKVFKKTVKKSTLKSPSNRGSTVGLKQYENALKSCISVKKVPILKTRRIHWQETSNIAESSSDENDDDVFTKTNRTIDNVQPKRNRPKETKHSSSETSELSPRKNLASSGKPHNPRKHVDQDLQKSPNRLNSSEETEEMCVRTTRSKAKGQTKQVQRPKVKNSKSSRSEMSPRKKAVIAEKIIKSPRKLVDQDLVMPFEAICLSPTKRALKQQATQPTNNTIDQTTNLTALFSGANDKITNSTEIANNTTANSSRSKKSTSRSASGFPDVSNSIVVYEPKAIQPGIGPNESIRITHADLKLDGVTKRRHLEKFKKFNHIIHPNSTVRFFPSDSEDDGPSTNMTTTNTDTDDESFDEDDPILTFNPRQVDRLNVLEFPYNRTGF